MVLLVILTISPGDATSVGYAHRHVQMNLYHVVGVTHGFIGDALTRLEVEEHVRHTFMSRIH